MFKYELNETQRNLLQRNMIEITDERIEGETFYYVREALLQLTAKGSPDIEVFISCRGGLVAPGLDTYDMLRYYRGKKIGIVVGYAMSMAAVLLQACDIRKAYRHSGILIHHIAQGSVSLDTLRNKKKTAALRESMEEDQQRQYEILSKRSGKTIEEIRNTCEKDVAMSVEEAKNFGLIDEII
jgi:ATP-dependent Clp protease protease subunit